MANQERSGGKTGMDRRAFLKLVGGAGLGLGMCVVPDRVVKLVEDLIPGVNTDGLRIPTDINKTNTPLAKTATPMPTETPTNTPSSTETQTATPTQTSTPTETPMPTETPIPDIGQLMDTARRNNVENFIAYDVAGREMTVDVVPLEVQGVGKWDWKYRGFTRQEADGVWVFRTLQAVGPDDRGKWFKVGSELNVPGYGTVTIEYDPVEMASSNGFKNIVLANPELWKAAFDVVWERRREYNKDPKGPKAALVEPLNNYIPKTITKDEANFHKDVFFPEGGYSIIFRAENDPRFFQAERYDGDAWLTFKVAADAGRVQTEMCPNFTPKAGFDLPGFYVAWGVGYYEWAVAQNGIDGFIEVAHGDQNPLRNRTNTPSSTYLKAARAAGIDLYNYKTIYPLIEH